MPRLEVPIARDGPIVEVRPEIGPEDAANRVATGRDVLTAISVLGLVDTGAQMTAIQRMLAQRIDLPVFETIDVGSSVLGEEVCRARTGKIRMTFGSLEAGDSPRWRILHAVGVSIVSPSLTILIGRDVLATCRFTYDGRKRRFMMSY